ncbi:Serine/threonine-protein kinase AfsK [Streptomyces sp. MH60]|nr:Serine/threonine-protein kinase AfsK [Streptomyces sp. MH60]
MAVEFCAGPGLPEAVAAHGPLGSGDLAALAAALAEALAAVHAAGLVHRDVKPSNVLISRHGPKVIDFGIAKSAADESLTADSEAVGSPGFIAPEQLAGDTAGLVPGAPQTGPRSRRCSPGAPSARRTSHGGSWSRSPG